jgi:hypothetical protein
MHCYISTASWLRERATMLRYTYIVCLVILSTQTLGTELENVRFLVQPPQFVVHAH